MGNSASASASVPNTPRSSPFGEADATDKSPPAPAREKVDSFESSKTPPISTINSKHKKKYSIHNSCDNSGQVHKRRPSSLPKMKISGSPVHLQPLRKEEEPPSLDLTSSFKFKTDEKSETKKNRSILQRRMRTGSLAVNSQDDLSLEENTEGDTLKTSLLSVLVDLPSQALENIKSPKLFPATTSNSGSGKIKPRFGRAASAGNLRSGQSPNNSRSPNNSKSPNNSRATSPTPEKATRKSRFNKMDKLAKNKLSPSNKAGVNKDRLVHYGELPPPCEITGKRFTVKPIVKGVKSDYHAVLDHVSITGERVSSKGTRSKTGDLAYGVHSRAGNKMKLLRKVNQDTVSNFSHILSVSF